MASNNETHNESQDLLVTLHHLSNIESIGKKAVQRAIVMRQVSSKIQYAAAVIFSVLGAFALATIVATYIVWLIGWMGNSGLPVPRFLGWWLILLVAVGVATLIGTSHADQNDYFDRSSKIREENEDVFFEIIGLVDSKNEELSVGE